MTCFRRLFEIYIYECSVMLHVFAGFVVFIWWGIDYRLRPNLWSGAGRRGPKIDACCATQSTLEMRVGSWRVEVVSIVCCWVGFWCKPPPQISSCFLRIMNVSVHQTETIFGRKAILAESPFSSLQTRRAPMYSQARNTCRVRHKSCHIQPINKSHRIFHVWRNSCRIGSPETQQGSSPQHGFAPMLRTNHTVSFLVSLCVKTLSTSKFVDSLTI